MAASRGVAAGRGAASDAEARRTVRVFDANSIVYSLPTKSCIRCQLSCQLFVYSLPTKLPTFPPQVWGAWAGRVSRARSRKALAALLEGVARDGGVAILRAWAGARPQKLTV